MNNDLALSAIELCAGVGMLGEGVRAGFEHLGFTYRTVCYVEREAHAASDLVARMEEGSLDAAPIWADMATFGGRAWRGKVDCVIAGFPCQDLSIAGKREGLNAPRSGLFFRVLDIADDSGAQWLVLENVAGIASATASVVDEEGASEYVGNYHAQGFSQVGVEDGRLLERAAARVVGELADRGWHSEWITLSASDVGASHGRPRWFCFAWRMADTARDVGHGQERQAGSGRGIRQTSDRVGYAHSQREQRARREDGTESRERPWAGPGGPAWPGWPDWPGWPMVYPKGFGNGSWSVRSGSESTFAKSSAAVRDVVYTQSIGRRQGRAEYVVEQGRHPAASDGGAVAHTGRTGLPQRVSGGGLRDTAPERATGPDVKLHGRPFFAPGPADPRWAGIIERWPHLNPALEPTFRCVVNGLAFDMDDSRAARLKCVGNGVVALCAAVATVVLARRAGLKVRQ